MARDLLLVPALLCAAAGAVLVLAPGALPRIEALLNRTWGGRTLFTVRLGLEGERSAEEILNRPVLTRAVYWDHWLRRHPRVIGAVLLGLAAALPAWAIAG